MTSSSYVIQQLIPSLSTALARLRRTPGRNHGWVDEALKALEKNDATRFERIRRRIGFARRLGELSGLGEEEAASVTLGVLFHELITGQTSRSRSTTGSAWLAYLLRNEDWLAPAFALTESIGEGWETFEDKPSVVANVMYAFDVATVEQHERPLQVLKELQGRIETPAAEEVIPVLWAEEGQELCDYHFRRRPGSYKLAPAELKNCFEALTRSTVVFVPSEPAARPFRLSGSDLTVADKQQEQEERPAPRPAERQRRAGPAARPASRQRDEAPTTPAGFNFDRRRQMLRARAAKEPEQFVEPATPQRNHSKPKIEQPAEPEAPAVIIETPKADIPVIDAPTAKIGMPEQRQPAHIGPRKWEEDPMEQLHAMTQSAPKRSDALDMVQKLQDLRLQLGQIQRVAIDAEQLLTGLAPQLDELAAWISDLDKVVDRWRGGDQIERAA